MDVDAYKVMLWMTDLLHEFDRLQSAVKTARAADNEAALAQALADQRAFRLRHPEIDIWVEQLRG